MLDAKVSSASSWFIEPGRVRCAHTGSGADHICGPADYLCGASPDGDLSDDDLRRSGCAPDHNRDPVDRR